jgi:protein-tyrosine-phosphatase
MAEKSVLFICPHSAAKSVLATAYFRQLVAAQQLPFAADFAGMEPDDEIMPSVRQLLSGQGIDAITYRPRYVTRTDILLATHVVSLGCPIHELPIEPASFEVWDDIPLVSRNASLAAEVIYEKVEALVRRFAHVPTS